MRQLAFPRDQKSAQNAIPIQQDSFASALVADGPASDIPLDALYELKDLISYGEYLKSRPGSVLMNAAITLPTMRLDNGGVIIYGLTGKTGDTIYDLAFTTSDMGYWPQIGDYIVWPDGAHEQILSATVGIGDTYATVKVRSSIARIGIPEFRRPVWGREFNEQIGKLIIHIGAKLYYLQVSDFLSASPTGYVEIPFLGDLANKIQASRSHIRIAETQNDTIIFNAGGEYKIKSNGTEFYYYKMNSPNPTTLLTSLKILRNDVKFGKSVTTTTQEDATNDSPYGRRYTYNMTKMQGSVMDKDRYAAADMTVIQESGTVETGKDNKDYADVFSNTECGLGNKTYGVLEGTTVACNDDISQWKLILNGAFGINVNGIGVYDVMCGSFSAVENMADVAAQIQAGMQVYFPGSTCEIKINSTGNKVFRMTSGKVDGGTITAVTAPVGSGDDISTMINLSSATPDNTKIWQNGYHVKNLAVPTGSKHWTHYTLNSSRDIGFAQESKHIVADFLVWNIDIPVIRAFTCTTVETVTEKVIHNNILGLGKKFHRADEYNTMRFETAATRTLYGFRSWEIGGTYDSTGESSEMYITGGGTTITNKAAAIGASKVATATQVGNIVTLNGAGSYAFAIGDVGYILFWEDGTISHIKRYISTTSVEVVETATKAAQAVGWIPTTRIYVDTVEDRTLEDRANKLEFILQSRYFQPLPNSVIGEVVPGFLAVVDPADNVIKYSAIPFNKDYIAGYHHRGYQIDNKVTDKIKFLKKYPDKIVAFTSQNTWGTQTNVSSTIDTPLVGETIIKMTQFSLIANTGCSSPLSVQEINIGESILFTSDKELKTFNGVQYGDTNIGERRVMETYLEKFNAHVLSCYDGIGGYRIFGTNEEQSAEHNYINNADGDCLRLAVQSHQGILFSHLTGDNMVWPEPNINGILIDDSLDNKRMIMLDENTGLWYDISPRTGPEGSGIVYTDLDKFDGDDGGYEIKPSIILKEHTAQLEHMTIEHLESHIYLRPIDRAAGYRDDFAVDAYLYKNGELAYHTKSLAVPENCNLVMDRKTEGTRIQVEYRFSTGGIIITGMTTWYLAKDRGSATTILEQRSSEQLQQDEYSPALLWISRGFNLEYNRAVGVSSSGNYLLGITGPDGVPESAMQFDGVDNLETEIFSNMNSDFTIQFGIKI